YFFTPNFSICFSPFGRTSWRLTINKKETGDLNNSQKVNAIALGKFLFAIAFSGCIWYNQIGITTVLGKP
ncbi:MAG: hypothetical protein IIZ18_01660, partial [Ruminococcus sp.]|nr:hypothetical protein [Ruminococcus sp.]